MKRVLVLLSAILFGTPVFMLGVVLFPDARLVLDKDPGAPLTGFVSLVHVIAGTVFVAVLGACLVARVIRVPGFPADSVWRAMLLAAFPILFIGPMAALCLCIDGRHGVAAACLVEFALVATCFYALNANARRQRSSGGGDGSGTGMRHRAGD